MFISTRIVTIHSFNRRALKKYRRLRNAQLPLQGRTKSIRNSELVESCMLSPDVLATLAKEVTKPQGVAAPAVDSGEVWPFPSKSNPRNPAGP